MTSSSAIKRSLQRWTFIALVLTILTAFTPAASAQFSGWTVGLAGTILHTSDGTTWSPQVSGTTTFFFGVWFVDKLNGWAVGDGGTIVHTTDGGVTWLPQVSGTTNTLFGVNFVDANNGWAVGDLGVILHTANGGAAWAPQTSGTTLPLVGVSFPDANNGWVVGLTGIILHTGDGGATWSPQSSGTSFDLYAVSFIDSKHGWAVGLFGTILHTDDGGATWSPQASPSSFSLFGVVFVDINNGWAVGENGEVVHTSSGGESWEEQTTPTTQPLNGVSFVDAQNGWAVGGGEGPEGAVRRLSKTAAPRFPLPGGIIINTTNGGTTWTTQLTGIPILQAVNFPKAAPMTGPTPGTLDGTFQVKIFPNLGAGDSQINIGNTGASGTITPGSFAIGGNVCVNVYVFSPDEQEVACCSCLVTPNAVVTTSARQLVSKTLTPAVPTAVTVKLLATDGSGGIATCNAAAPAALAPGLLAFGTNLHLSIVGGGVTSGTYAVTETPFIPSILSAAELTRITTLCGFIQTNGTGFGICPGCTAGAAGSVRH